MSNQKNGGFFSNLASDLPASVVVFLVALPLCLGIAFLSEAPPLSGIIAGIVGGIVVALISGSPLGVSGPAAGLAAIVAGAIGALNNSFETFLLAVMVAGILQILLGIFKAGIIAYYFPSSVIKGMLSGIGVYILLKQIPHFFGYDKVPEGDMTTGMSELALMWDGVTVPALIIASVSLIILIVWEQGFIKQNKVLRFIPGPLLAVLAGIGLNMLFIETGYHVLEAEHLVNLPVAETAEEFWGFFALPDLRGILEPRIWMYGAIIALVASLETLLCVEATDKLDPLKRVTPTNRELIAQGAGNLVSGAIGGLPITQVIVRSSANIQSGGKTKAAAFFHGILLFGCVAFIPDFLNKIPYASLSAVLMVVGYKLAKPIVFKSMYKQGWTQFIPFIITVVLLPLTDLLLAISVGLVIAIFFILYNNYKTPYHFKAEDYKPGEPIRIQLSEDVSFLNKAGIMNTLNNLPPNKKIIIDAHKTQSIHPDVIEIIDDFKINAKSRGIEVELIGLNTPDQPDPVEAMRKAVK